MIQISQKVLPQEDGLYTVYWWGAILRP